MSKNLGYSHEENCKVTILETPVYSIYHWNCHRKHKSPDEFKDHDSTLADQEQLCLSSIQSPLPGFRYFADLKK
jgi:hypothetical protein